MGTFLFQSSVVKTTLKRDCTTAERRNHSLFILRKTGNRFDDMLVAVFHLHEYNRVAKQLMTINAYKQECYRYTKIGRNISTMLYNPRMVILLLKLSLLA